MQKTKEPCWKNLFTFMLPRLILSFGVFAFAISCTAKKDSEKSDSALAQTKEVNLAIWGNYFDPAEQERFSQTTGVKVNITNYSSNEELLAKIQSGASNIDVAVPSDYMVGIMIKMGLLEAIDKSKISNLSEVDPQFLKQAFDPENTFSVPYAWTTAGFAVHTEMVKEPVKSWKEIMSRSDLNGKISLLDDVRESMAVALKINGFSVNSTDPTELEKAKQTLLELKKKVKMFRSEIVDSLVRKEMAIAHSYGTEALQASVKSGGKIVFVIPEEGGTWSLDNVVIFKASKNKAAALQLVNFFLQPESNLNFVNRILSGPVLKKTRALLPADLKNNATLFPPKDRMSKLEAIQDVGEATSKYDRIWTEVKSK